MLSWKFLKIKSRRQTHFALAMANKYQRSSGGWQVPELPAYRKDHERRIRQYLAEHQGIRSVENPVEKKLSFISVFLFLILIFFSLI